MSGEARECVRGRRARRWCHWLLPVLLLADGANAQSVPASTEAPMARPKTCLVLGGGGARGAAHIGVLKVLERERIPVDCVVGTSMGAIVGGLYAAGYSADEIQAVLEAIDWSEVLRDKPPRDARSMRRKEDDLRLLGGVEFGVHEGRIAFPSGIIQGQKLEMLLRRLLLATWDVQDFDDLPIPFRAVATDIVSGDKVVFARGDVATAVRASMSVPGVFAPVRVDGRLLVDGGVIDNLPIDEARKLGAQRLIVSRVGTPLMTEDQLDTPLALSHQMANVLMTRLVEAQVATLGAQDVLIKPDLGDMTSQDFNRATQAVPLGEAAAQASVDALRRASVSPSVYAQFEQRHRPPAYAAPIVSFVQVQGEQTRTAAYVAQRLDDQPGRPLDIETVERRLGNAYGEGRYEQLQWRLARGEDGRVGLVVDPQDKRWGPDFLHFGLRVSDDFEGANNYQLTTEYTRTGLSELGAELKLRASLGDVEEAYAEYFSPFGAHARQAWSVYGGFRATDQELVLDRGVFAQYRYSQWLGGVRWTYSPHEDWEASLSLERGREWLSLRVGNPDELTDYHAELGSVAVQLRHDSIDSSSFPTRGARLSLTYQEFLEDLGASGHGGVTRLQWDHAWSHGPHRLLGGVRANLSTGSKDLLATYGFLGGMGNLSGYGEQSIFAPQTALARLVYFRRFAHADSLLTIPLYVGGSVEAGGVWNSRSEVDTRGLVGAGSVFVGADTFLGPVFLGYGRAETGQSAFYLTFGSLLRSLDGF